MPRVSFRWTILAVVALLGVSQTLQGQDAGGISASKKDRNPLRMLFFPTPNDALLPITSLEWGVPDRVSFTSRYVHMFQKDRDHKANLHNFTLTVSPGSAGGRIGVGYENVHDTGKSSRDPGGRKNPIALLSEGRVVLLRTWGDPLHVAAHQRFVGGELRTSLAGLVNVSVGYYSARSPRAGERKSFWGVHAGFGI